MMPRTTRREITREQRDTMVLIRRHNWASARVEIAAMQLDHARRMGLSIQRRIGTARERAKFLQWAHEALTEARESVAQARRYGWKLP